MRNKKKKRAKAKPVEQMSPTEQIMGQDERLTTDEKKSRFARNFDRLINLIGMSRKAIADEIGIAHKLVLRLVSTGVSRTDERNIEGLTKIAAFFALPSVDDFCARI